MTMLRFKDLKIRGKVCNHVINNLLIVIALCSLFPVLIQAQVDTAWVRIYNGPRDSADIAYALAIDSQGNVCVTGESGGLGTGPDYLTIKYNPSGDTVWTRRYSGPGNSVDQAYEIAVDPQGNVYVTGVSDNDFVTIKYNANGEVSWINRYNGPGNSVEIFPHIALDNAGDVYVAGSSIDSVTGRDYATIKYNSAGVEQWVARYNGPANGSDEPVAIALDGQGNVYVTGYSDGSSTYTDYATVKYDTNGDTVWVRRYNGPGNSYDSPRFLTVDGQGNIYVTGASIITIGVSSGYLTIKYNSLGDTLWARLYQRPGTGYNIAEDIAVDNQGNVCITGVSYIVGNTNTDYLTIKYNSNGDMLWTRIYDYQQGNYFDYAFDITLDNSGNVYVTGQSDDYDSNDDWATIKYSSTGDSLWVSRYDGHGGFYQRPYDLVVDGQYSVYVTGSIERGTTESTQDYATIKYVQTQGIEENRSLLSADRSSLEVYPNPAKTYFTTRLPQTTNIKELKIFDVSGKLIKEIEIIRFAQNDGVGEAKISLKGINPGIYFIQAGNETRTKKLVVER